MSYLKSIFCWFFPKYRRLTGVFVEISSLPACRRKYFILKLKQRGLLDFKITGSSNSRTEKAIQTALFNFQESYKFFPDSWGKPCWILLGDNRQQMQGVYKKKKKKVSLGSTSVKGRKENWEEKSQLQP